MRTKRRRTIRHKANVSNRSSFQWGDLSVRRLLDTGRHRVLSALQIPATHDSAHDGLRYWVPLNAEYRVAQLLFDVGAAIVRPRSWVLVERQDLLAQRQLERSHRYPIDPCLS